MNKTNIFIAVMLVALSAFSAFSQAKQALSKELIISFGQMSEQWEVLEVDYPEVLASLDDIDLSQPEKIITQLKNSKAYPKIKSILAKSDFTTIEEYYDVAMRVMGGMIGFQMQSMPEGMNVDSTVQMLKQNIQQMKASNVPSSMIDEMEKQLVDMEKNMKNMKEAMKNTSAADIKFISENAQWVMSVLGDK